ncbi:hypothetical protein E2320_020884 [Naja naja]|nr:hypothetical protein E2320_020884 [Naja naja]
MAIEEAQAAEMSHLSGAEIQGTTSSPAAKPNATVHFEEITPDEILDYGEDRSRVSTPQQRHDAADLADISNHRKKAYFLSFCGAAVFDTATALSAPQYVKEVSWEAPQEILSNHYTPKSSRIARWLAFRWQAQAEGGTISMYMALSEL